MIARAVVLGFLCGVLCSALPLVLVVLRTPRPVEPANRAREAARVADLALRTSAISLDLTKRCLSRLEKYSDIIAIRERSE